MCRRSIISMYHPKSPYTVYCNDCFASDQWDPFAYALDYNPHQPFFEQLGELLVKVPKSATYSSPASGPNVNSEYTNFAGGNKDCYLIFNSGPSNENCAYSRGLIRSRDVFDTYYGDEIENTKDCADMLGHCRNSELLYNGVGIGAGAGNVICSWWVESSQDIEYSFTTRSSHDCFGCDAIKNGAFVILNKKYSKDEYQQIRNRIVAELKGKDLYGDFFPIQLAFFAYNETIAQDNMPLTVEEALRAGFRWEENVQKTEGRETVQPENIPDSIKDILNDFVNEILVCTECSRNYKLISRELEFYRKMLIPIPRKCWNCRFTDRLRLRGSYKFWQRTCDKCHKEITTNYAPDAPEVIYCERCYQREVY